MIMAGNFQNVRRFALAIFLLGSGFFVQVRAQALPPQLFSEMDGLHFLEDGSAVPMWGYGWVTDGFITLPGPLLTYNEGQSVDLNFTNPSPESHTIHLHGLDVDQANDGVPTTSFLVPTGGSATYSFAATHAGTFLYHCHVTTTLHLTMGMYGMILVKRSDQTLFSGGPHYDQDVPLLFSDLEVETNLNSVQSFPFHDIRPDVFMVNGMEGSQLAAPEQVVHSAPGDTLALRLGSMAYSRVRCHFPAELHATCFMSDGRSVPEPFGVDSLDIWPGERFTVLVAPDPGWTGTLACEFWNMVDHVYEDTEMVHFESSLTGVPTALAGARDGQGFPNPTNSTYNFPPVWGASAGSNVPLDKSVTVWDLQGREYYSGPLSDGRLDVSQWPAGTYVARCGSLPHTRFSVIH
jgi:FtsP/CotA-like multicopper oxidase with cupredoxin domain